MTLLVGGVETAGVLTDEPGHGSAKIVIGPVASDRSKLLINGQLYETVTGEQEKSSRTFQEMIEAYPGKASAHFGLGEAAPALDLTRAQAAVLKIAGFRVTKDSGRK